MAVPNVLGNKSSNFDQDRLYQALQAMLKVDKV